MRSFLRRDAGIVEPLKACAIRHSALQELLAYFRALLLGSRILEPAKEGVHHVSRDDQFRRDAFVIRNLRPFAVNLLQHALILLLLASPVSAQEKLFTVSEWAVLSGHALDAAATQRCLGSGDCHELNHWLARYDSPVAFTAAKMTVASLQLWAVRKLKPSHPKLAIVTNYAISAGFVAVAVRNERVGR